MKSFMVALSLAVSQGGIAAEIVSAEPRIFVEAIVTAAAVIPPAAAMDGAPAECRQADRGVSTAASSFARSRREAAEQEARRSPHRSCSRMRKVDPAHLPRRHLAEVAGVRVAIALD